LDTVNTAKVTNVIKKCDLILKKVIENTRIKCKLQFKPINIMSYRIVHERSSVARERERE